MQRTIKKRLINRTMTGLLLSLLWTATQAAAPLWTIVPATGSNPTQTVPENSTATVQYVVQNQSKRPKKLIMQYIPGIAQTTPCPLTPKGQAGSSCILNLAITGSMLPQTGVHGGPVLCQANMDGKPNPNQCYQPNSTNSLHITKGSTPPAAIELSVSGSPLTLTAGGASDTIMVTNMSASATALQISADFSGTALAGNVTQDASQCTSLAPGASCFLTFTPGTTAVTQASFPIKGSNTQQVAAAIAVETPTQATIAITAGSPLILQSPDSGALTIANQSTVLTALNISAQLTGTDLDGEVIQDATDCESVSPQGSCTLTFTPGTNAVSATNVIISGDNTSQTTASIAVNAAALIEIAITGGANLPLVTNDPQAVGWMVIHNNSTTEVASNISADLTTTDLNGHVTQDETACESLNPGESCTLRFTVTGTDDVSATQFSVQGTNTTAVSGEISISTIDNVPPIGNDYRGGLTACGNVPDTNTLIIAADSDYGSIAWGGSGTATGATDSTNGAGNTATIVDVLTGNNIPIDSYAAGVCSTYQIDQDGQSPCQSGICYEGWFLPALNQMSCLYGNRNNLNLNELGLYWTSTESSLTLAWGYSFEGYEEAIAKTYDLSLVRCVRAFVH